MINRMIDCSVDSGFPSLLICRNCVDVRETAYNQRVSEEKRKRRRVVYRLKMSNERGWGKCWQYQRPNCVIMIDWLINRLVHTSPTDDRIRCDDSSRGQKADLDSRFEQELYIYIARDACSDLSVSVHPHTYVCRQTTIHPFSRQQRTWKDDSTDSTNTWNDTLPPPPLLLLWLLLLTYNHLCNCLQIS